ncbi:MAG: hypothetical protein P1U61_00695 [Legionellaceae bacterium]|nr:hypothetical protein [Legionellaceae bacterium]
MKVFFKRLDVEASLFSIDLPDAVCVGMLHPILELYLQLNQYESQDMLLSMSEVAEPPYVGCIIIQMSDFIEPHEKQAFAEKTLSNLVRFFKQYAVTRNYFFYVHELDGGGEYYKARACLKQNLAAYVRKLGFEAEVFDILKETLNAGLATRISIQIVERMLSKCKGEAQRSALDDVACLASVSLG